MPSFPPKTTVFEGRANAGEDGMHVLDHEQIDLLAMLIDRNPAVPVPVIGPCMRPWIRSGDQVLVSALRRPVRVGMILLIRANTQLFTHRVVETRRFGWVRTRGDLDWGSDPWRSPADVLGQVVAVKRPDGTVLRLEGWLAERGGRVLAAPLRLARTGLRVVRKLRRLGLYWFGQLR